MNKWIRIVCFALCLCLLLILSPLQFVSAQSDVIRINSLEEFLAFADNCRLDQFSQGKTFRLATDIDLTGIDFDGIPIFCGTFEGGDHFISGLKVTGSGSTKGLFRYLETSAAVRDLKVEGTIVPSGARSQVGGIAGSNAGLIENCSFTGSVIGADYIGGIAGRNLPSGVMKNCYAEGVVSGKHFVGGIAGSNEGSIENCENRADVNNTAQQNDITISDITLDSLLSVESAAASTDIGGIAGISSGMILESINRGEIGYPHMGYNIGGIVGLQSGYVSACENYGAVCGRKDVGGIAGQQEPQVMLKYSTDTLQILQSQIAVLSDLVDRAVINGNGNATHIRNLLYKLERHAKNAEEASDYLKEALKKPSFKDLDSYADAIDTIRQSVTGISDTLRSLWEVMDGSMTDLDQDMKAISLQIAQIEATLNDADANLGGQIFDISDQDTADQLGSKLENCHNFGIIAGDLHIGGILGAVSFENDLDPEEDITVIGQTSLNAIGNVRSVIVNCSNGGIVSAKYQRVGGIAGWLSLGLIKECIHTGTVGGDTVDLAGGIAGECLGFIRNCKVKARVYGDANIGGIAGKGCIATDCYAMVSLEAKEHMGGIFGELTQSYHDLQTPIEKNYYYTHGVDIGGIDGISYEQKAKGLSLEIFLILCEDDPFFHYVTVTFLADGEVIEQAVLPTGSPMMNVPAVPEKEGYIGNWAGLRNLDLTELVFDLTVRAEYTPYTTTIQSQEVSETGRPILLLQGEFETHAGLSLEALDHYAGIGSKQTLLQGWKFTVDGVVELQAGRLLIPSGVNTDRTIILVRDANGNWTERTFRADESYLIFSIGKGDNAIALVAQQGSSVFTFEILIAACAGALAVLIIVFFCSKIRNNGRASASKDPTE